MPHYFSCGYSGSNPDEISNFAIMRKQFLITENQFFYLLNNKAIEDIKKHLEEIYI